MFEEDVDISKSATLDVYGAEIKDKRTSSKSLATTKNAEKKEECVDQKIERLKEQLLAELEWG